MTAQTKKKTTRKKTTRKKTARRPSAGAEAQRVPSVRAAAIAAATGRALSFTGGALAVTGRAAWRGVKALARSRDAQRVLTLSLLSGALVFASGAAKARVMTWPEFSVAPDALAADQPPPGLSRAALDDMTRLPLPRSANAYDRRLVPFTAALLSELQWVAEVERVQMTQPAGLRFSLETRRPVARVEEQGAVRVLTHDHALIDPRYAANPEGLPRVTGLPGGAQMLGRQRALEGAVDVLGKLADLKPPVESLDVSGLCDDPRKSAVLVTLVGGLVVEWGRPDTDERPHLPGESKRAALEEFLEQGPPLANVERVSLRWDETTYVLRTGTPLR